MTLCNRYDQWLTAQKYAPVTRRQYSREVENYGKFLDSKSFTASTHFDVQEYLASRATNGACTRTLRGALYSLRIFFDFLNLGGLVHWVPPRLIHPRQPRECVPRVLSKQQVKKLFASTRNRLERALLETLYGTGCRTGEVRTMRIEDIDFTNCRIRVRGKSGTRFVMFTPRVLHALRAYLAGRQTGYVFVESRGLQQILPVRTKSGAWRCRWRYFDENGKVLGFHGGFVRSSVNLSYLDAVIHFANLAKPDRIHRPIGIHPISLALIDRTVRQVGLRAGIRVFPYCLRHSFATHLLDNGADIRVIQELMGHANIHSTQGYTKVSKELAAQTVRKFHPRR